MAEALQREWSLPVLKVFLDASSADPQVRIRLLTHHDGQPSLEGEWTHLLSEFGSWSSDRGRGPELQPPQGAVKQIAEWVHNRLGPRAELWLHLVKPYAHLGALDWEGELQPALGVPLLRLPDVFPIPEIHRSVVTVAVCASGPAVKGPPPALEALPLIARAFASIGREVRFHIFADEAAGTMAGLPDLEGVTVEVHNPVDAPAPADLWPGVVNPWLRWMLAARDDATDVVHFVGHGYYGNEQGWLALAGAPRGDRSSASHIGSNELASFLTSMGAAAVGFSNTPDNYSPPGLRALVDALGASRAGPVLLHSPESDPEGAQLQGAYGFLFGERGRRPPPNPSLLFFCQPDRLPRKVVRGLEPIKEETPIDDLGATSSVRDYFAGQAAGQPKWVAVTERFLDQHRANLLRQRTSSEDPRTETPLDAYSEGVEAALREIRGIVDRHVPAPPAVTTSSG
ncbi:MAG: hypothetical protein ACRDWA_01845 [Acidimicrobiia bacterium]